MDKKMRGWMNSQHTAEYMDMSVHTIRDLAEDGRLSGCKRGQCWYFRPEDADDYLEQGRIRVRSVRRSA